MEQGDNINKNEWKLKRWGPFIAGLVFGAVILVSSVAVRAAYSLDGNVLPSADYLYRLGTASVRWTGINSLLYLDSAGNVGVGTASPASSLEVNGGVRITGGTKPGCDSTQRGTLWYTPGGGAKDIIDLCAKDASGTYAWRTIY
jgi:hypothetical protein